MARHYVTARYNEVIDFQTGGSGDVITKGIHIPNLGREASSWILWILNNYCKLPDCITFLQGNPFDHTTMEEITAPIDTHYKRHGQLLECDQYGNPHHGGLNLNTGANIMGIQLTQSVRFCMGAQFTCHRDQILKYPYEKWAQLFAYSVTDKNAPWELERLWEVMLS